jgi:flavin reductase
MAPATLKHSPRKGHNVMSDISGDELNKIRYRDCMSRHGVSVSVVTTQFEGKRYGFTATAVCSVSDTPPTLLVCINRMSSSFRAFTQASHFCVNLLMPGQEGISNAFGGKRPQHERFELDAWRDGAHGTPILSGAAVFFVCRLTRSIDEASHSILLGQVLDMQENQEPGALLYYQRKYIEL